LIGSLLSRLEILGEELERRQTSNEPAKKSNKQTAVQKNAFCLPVEQTSLLKANIEYILPRRVLVPFDSVIFLSDYQFVDEDVRDCEERCVAILSLVPPSSSESISWLKPVETFLQEETEIVKIHRKKKQSINRTKPTIQKQEELEDISPPEPNPVNSFFRLMVVSLLVSIVVLPLLSFFVG